MHLDQRLFASVSLDSCFFIYVKVFAFNYFENLFLLFVNVTVCFSSHLSFFYVVVLSFLIMDVKVPKFLLGLVWSLLSDGCFPLKIGIVLPFWVDVFFVVLQLSILVVLFRVELFWILAIRWFVLRLQNFVNLLLILLFWVCLVLYPILLLGSNLLFFAIRIKSRNAKNSLYPSNFLSIVWWNVAGKSVNP